MWYMNVDILRFFRCVTIHWFDRQTDRQAAFSWLDRVACNACSAVKTNYYSAVRDAATPTFFAHQEWMAQLPTLQLFV